MTPIVFRFPPEKEWDSFRDWDQKQYALIPQDLPDAIEIFGWKNNKPQRFIFRRTNEIDRDANGIIYRFEKFEEIK